MELNSNMTNKGSNRDLTSETLTPDTHLIKKISNSNIRLNYVAISKRVANVSTLKNVNSLMDKVN